MIRSHDRYETIQTMGEENSASKGPRFSGGEPQADMFWW